MLWHVRPAQQPRPRWFFDEFAHAGAEHLDPEYVAAYDRKARSDPSEDLAVLSGVGLSERSVLVDLGAGTGTFSIAAAPWCGRVVAVDISPAMLAALEAKLDRSGTTNVECVRAGFLTYEHRGDVVDFVYSRNALHHLPDVWKAIALERIATLLRPAGVLRLRDLVFSFTLPEASRVLEAWLSAAPRDAAEGWTRKELETHLREEYSTFSWLLEPMLQRAGFQVQAATHSVSQTYSAYTCVKR